METLQPYIMHVKIREKQSTLFTHRRLKSIIVHENDFYGVDGKLNNDMYRGKAHSNDT